MPESQAIYLEDMLEAIDVINDIVREKSASELKSHRRDRGALERNFEIVSEASKHLHVEFKQAHPEIPCKKIVGLGNLLRHEYAAVEVGILCTIARVELPILERVRRAELEREKKHDPEIPPGKNS